MIPVAGTAWVAGGPKTAQPVSLTPASRANNVAFAPTPFMAGPVIRYSRWTSSLGLGIEIPVATRSLAAIMPSRPCSGPRSRILSVIQERGRKRDCDRAGYSSRCRIASRASLLHLAPDPRGIWGMPSDGSGAIYTPGWSVKVARLFKTFAQSLPWPWQTRSRLR